MNQTLSICELTMEFFTHSLTKGPTILSVCRIIYVTLFSLDDSKRCDASARMVSLSRRMDREILLKKKLTGR